MTMLISAGVDQRDMHSIPDRVRKLEDLGWNSVSVGETQHNPFLPLMLVAEHTTQMQFATSVAIATFTAMPTTTTSVTSTTTIKS